MAKKVILLSQEDIAGGLGSCPEAIVEQGANQSIDVIVKKMTEAIECYLETLTAEERENRLSR